MAVPRIDSISPQSQHRASHKPCVLKIYQLLLSVAKDRKKLSSSLQMGGLAAFLNLRSFHGRHVAICHIFMAILQLALSSHDFESPVLSMYLCLGSCSRHLVSTLNCVTKGSSGAEKLSRQQSSYHELAEKSRGMGFDLGSLVFCWQADMSYLLLRQWTV